VAFSVGGGGGGGGGLSHHAAGVVRTSHGEANNPGANGSATISYTLPAVTTSLTSSAAEVEAGTPVVFTATIDAAGGWIEGNVSFVDGAGNDLVCNEGNPVPTPDPRTDPWEVVCTITPLVAGDLTVYARKSFGGTAPNLSRASQSDPVSVGVTRAPTTTQLEWIAEDGVARATVQGAAPIDGTVTFTNLAPGGPALTGCANVAPPQPRGNSVVANCEIATRIGSTYELRATYNPGPNTEASTGDLEPFTVEFEDTETRLELNATSLTYGQEATATATVSVVDGSATVDGTVAFVESLSTPIAGCAAVEVVAGKATCTYRPRSGNRSISASFSGGTQTRASDSSSVSFEVAVATPTVGLTASPGGSQVAGQPVTLLATVGLPQGGQLDEGTVEFSEDGSVIGPCAAVAVATGAASCTFTPTAGSQVRTFSASYDGTSDVSDGGPATIGDYKIDKLGTTTTLTTGTGSTVPAGTALNLVATVNPTSGAATPSGAVTFRDNGQTATCTGSGESNPAGLGGDGSARCTIVASAGIEHVLTASYGGDGTYAGSANSATVAVGRFASETALAVTPADPRFGDLVTLQATVLSGGSSAGGSVVFADGATPIASCAGVAVVGGVASCQVRPGAGDRSFTATFSGSTEAAASVSEPVATTVDPVPAGANATIGPTGPDELTAVVTVDAPVTPSGTATFTFDGSAVVCRDVALVPAAAGDAVAACTWAEPGLLLVDHEVVVELDLAPGFVAPAQAPSAKYSPAASCVDGFAARWADFTDDPTDRAIGGVVGEVTATVTSPQPLGPCRATTPIGFTAAVTLFGGALESVSGSPVTGTISATGGLCLTAGSFEPAVALPDVGIVTIVAPVCFELTDAGGLGAIMTGQLTAMSPTATFPVVGLGAKIVGSEPPRTSVGFDSASQQLVVRSVSGSDADPDIELRLRVFANGAALGSLSTPGVVVLGQSLTGLHVAISGSVAGSLTFAGSTTLGPIQVSPDLVLRDLQVTLAGAGFGLSGRASLGRVGHTLEAVAEGSYAAPDDWSLAITTAGAAVWEPLPNLRLPGLTGTVQADGATDISYSVGAARGAGPPLASWRPDPSIDLEIVVDEVRLDDDPACAGLAITGAIEAGDIRVPVAGCIDLGTGAFRLAATGGPSSGPEGTTLRGVTLEVTRSTAGTVAVGGDATVEVTTASGAVSASSTFRLAGAGTFVLGGTGPLDGLGLPTDVGYVAYATAAVADVDTGVPGVGVIDLRAGLSASGAWTASRANGTASLLEQAGFALPATDRVLFRADLAPGQPVRFVATLADPSAFPLLALPDGAQVDDVELVFTTGGLALDGAARVQSTRDIALSVVIDTTDGSFAGSAQVTNLVVFGRTLTFGGPLRGRHGVNAAIVNESPSTTVAGPFTPPGLIDVEWRDVVIRLGATGFSATGTMKAGGRDGLAFEGAMPTSLTTWSFPVTSEKLTVAWSPTAGLDTEEALTGTIESARPTPTAPPAITFDLRAMTDIDFRPEAKASVLVQLTEIRLSNRADRPDTCLVDRPNGVWLGLTGRLEGTLGNVSGAADATGCLELPSGAMKVVATLTSLTYTDLVAGVTVTSPVVTVARAPYGQGPVGSPIYTTITATVGLDITMPSGPPLRVLDAELHMLGSTWAVGASVDLSPWMANAGTFAAVYYAKDDLNIQSRVMGTADSLGELKLKKGVNVAFRVSLDPGTADKVAEAGGGSPGTVMLTAIGRWEQEISAFSLEIRFRMDFGDGGATLFETADGVSLTLDEGFLKMTVSATSISFQIGLQSTLRVPPATPEARAAGSPVQEVALIGAITISDTAFSVSLQLGDCDAGPGWADAFGVVGLTVQCAAVQGGVSYAGVPSVGLVGKITSLPKDVADAIGFVNGSPVTFAFNLEPFVLSIAIGTPNSGRVAIRPLTFAGAPDLIKVDYAGLYMAPREAYIGQTYFPAGYGIGFQANVHGVRVDILGKMNPSAPSIDVRASVSKVQVGALGLGPVLVELKGSKTGFSFTLDASLSLGPATVDIGPAIRLSADLGARVQVSIGLTGLSAYFEGHARGSLSALLAQSACYYSGVLPYPCDWEWKSVSFDVRLARTGFSVDASGLTFSYDGHTITIPWKDVVDPGASSGAVASVAPAPLASPEPGGRPDGSADLAETADLSSGLDPSGRGAVPASIDAPAVARASSASVVAPAVARATGSSSVLASPIAAGSASYWAPSAEEPTEQDATIGPDDIVPPQPIDEIPTPGALIDDQTIVAPPSGGDVENTRPAGDETVVAVDDAALPTLVPGRADGTWRSTDSLRVARAHGITAPLPDGRVLVAGGGTGGGNVTAEAEVFDPSAGTWSPTGSMLDARVGATATVLPDGRVLVAGGSNGTESLASSEIYDPVSGTWSRAASMAQPRRFASAAVLGDGSVLVAGGLDAGAVEAGQPLAGSEVYDPVDGTWRVVGELGEARAFSAVARLADGSVLVSGGQGAGGALASAEVFDPASGAWRPVAPMPSARLMDTATTLLDGRVLVAGSEANGVVYDPATDQWSKTGAQSTVRFQAMAARLPDGTVLLAGGGAGGSVQATAEVYDPTTNSWRLTPDMPVATSGAAVTVLPNGSVLVDGGTVGEDVLSASMVYEPAVLKPISVPAPVPAPSSGFTADAQGASPARENLVRAGLDVAPLLALAGALLLAGAVVLAAARRRTAR